MPGKATFYLYNDEQPLSDAEREVIAKGYPYVSTTRLDPGDRLNEHRHHSNNTHFVIQGSIVISKSRDSEPRFRDHEVFPYSYVDLPRGVDYMGVAGKEGCIFVEGHKQLSPATADRFRIRKTLKKMRKSTKGAFKVEEHE
ncbi:hypothetical protein LTR35_005932 [Friedmanniomyces endolithicus]|uniref:Uncharacterized protein n=1 Tax=Friedmanniomyces endolithicus TaxID=329885 RepID=A0AAN6G4E8_9PEZI|nr:hypothetical protein LTR35_005932 [Friedmanniomyces endolithicus]KAK0327584.1 hypothetical protein LTR82_001099 [Friedmanniomyces endolithicus]